MRDPKHPRHFTDEFKRQIVGNPAKEAHCGMGVRIAEPAHQKIAAAIDFFIRNEFAASFTDRNNLISVDTDLSVE